MGKRKIFTFDTVMFGYPCRKKKKKAETFSKSMYNIRNLRWIINIKAKIIINLL